MIAAIEKIESATETEVGAHFDPAFPTRHFWIRLNHRGINYVALQLVWSGVYYKMRQTFHEQIRLSIFKELTR